MNALIDRACAGVRADVMWVHLEEFSRRVKLSGTPEELESFRYLQKTLDGYGYTTRLIEHPAYISLPGRAAVELGGLRPRCITHSMSRSSPPGGLSGEAVYLKAGAPADFATTDVRGKIVILDGMATPPATARASAAGAIGQIHVSPHEHIHEMCVSPVWGSPGTETSAQLPTTVVVTVSKHDGEALKKKLNANERVIATISAEVDTGWRDIPLLEADLMPERAKDDVPFVLFSGHHDTWYLGVMDNGGANATMLEVARLAALDKDKLKRGLRFCFWSGHSHGRYAGSSWYADNRWMELMSRCVAHVNVDSTGARGNTVLADAQASVELQGLAREAVATRGQQDLDGHRMGRAGDQSFWGIGIPSIFMGMGEQPAGVGENAAAGLFGGNRKGAGFGWWWHTPEDTLDKMDRELLVRDTRIYVHTVMRLLTDTRIPLDLEAQVRSIAETFKSIASKTAPHFDAADVQLALDRLTKALPEAHSRASGPEALNAALMAASRALVPIDYTDGDRFSHGPALPHNPLPVLDPVRLLADAETDEEKFVRSVSARRACNRLAFALREATDALLSVK